MSYTVVVRDPNSWSSSSGIHTLLRDCGHKHRSVSAAQACMTELLAAQCVHGTRIGKACSLCLGGRAQHANCWSADWHRAEIEDNFGRGVDLTDLATRRRLICNKLYRKSHERWRCVLFLGHAGECSPFTLGVGA